jgi:hypothetical protein
MCMKRVQQIVLKGIIFYYVLTTDWVRDKYIWCMIYSFSSNTELSLWVAGRVVQLESQLAVEWPEWLDFVFLRLLSHLGYVVHPHEVLVDREGILLRSFQTVNTGAHSGPSTPSPTSPATSTLLSTYSFRSLRQIESCDDWFCCPSLGWQNAGFHQDGPQGEVVDLILTAVMCFLLLLWRGGGEILAIRMLKDHWYWLVLFGPCSTMLIFQVI